MPARGRTTGFDRCIRFAPILLGATLALHLSAPAQVNAPVSQADAILNVQVLDDAGAPVTGARLTLEAEDHHGPPSSSSDALGRFSFRDLQPGGYVLNITSGPNHSEPLRVSVSKGTTQQLQVVLPSGQRASYTPDASKSVSNSDFNFSDKPSFTVAGVTDWTAVGGHGSDATLRTSEDLNRETLALQSRAAAGGASHTIDPAVSAATQKRLQAALAAEPGSYAANRDLGLFYLRAGGFSKAITPMQAAYDLHHAQSEDAFPLALACRGSGDVAHAREIVQTALKNHATADLHRLAGELAEAAGDPVRAVAQAEAAARLEPSEENYLSWGSELLLHRAIWQASQVFAAGARLHPASARLMTAWGAALFSEALYEKAAETLCTASDLDPTYREPYVFLGKASIASPVPLPCAQTKLEFFLRQHPADAEVDYYFAMVLLQQNNAADAKRAEALLQKATVLDPKLADAYLQLGVLAFQRKDYAAAVMQLTKAIDADPNQGEAHYRLGVIYDRQGNKAQAQQEFKLHDGIDAANAARVEQQRREIKQFLVVTAPQAKLPQE